MSDAHNSFYIDWFAKLCSQLPDARQEHPKNGFDRTDGTIWHGGGGVKLLLRCLQSIQCQYYLVFGVVKTVPVQSFARMREFILPPYLFLLFPCPKYLHDTNGPTTTTWRTVIDTYILHLLSLRSFPYYLHCACMRARLALCHPSKLWT